MSVVIVNLSVWLNRDNGLHKHEKVTTMNTTIAQFNYHLLAKIGVFSNPFIHAVLKPENGFIEFQVEAINMGGETYATIGTNTSGFTVTASHTEKVAHVARVNNDGKEDECLSEANQFGFDVMAFHLLSSIATNGFILFEQLRMKG